MYYHPNTFKNHHNASHNKNQTRNSRRTVWPCGGVNQRDLDLQRGLPVFHWLYQSIWQTMIWWDNHKTDAVEDRCKQSSSDQKHVGILGTGSWWGNKLILKNRA